MKRMKLEDTWTGVRITYWDTLEERMISRHFTAPSGRVGYVSEGDGQVCEELAGMGRTLMASADTLARVIRREYRAMRRAEREVSARRVEGALAMLNFHKPQ